MSAQYSWSWFKTYFVASTVLSSTKAHLYAGDNWRPWQRCQNVTIRKEWSELQPAERKAFTDAELCLQKVPSVLDARYNSRSYYDDFVAVHINQTLGIHDDGVFLPWHREFISLFEQALQDKCGYIGVLPYWNWPMWASSLSTSPLFDGSATSLSGDGYTQRNETYMIDQNVIPHGSGGGCVKSGPFVNYTVIYQTNGFQDIFTLNGTLPPDAFKKNERCFNRDLNTYVATRATSQTVVDTLLASKTFPEFNDQLDIRKTPNPNYAQDRFLQDIFASPADPVFWLHHAQLDRVWSQWQAAGTGLDRIYGANAMSGGNTTFNVPPSPNVTMNYVMNWNVLGREKTIQEVMDVQACCYKYT